MTEGYGKQKTGTKKYDDCEKMAPNLGLKREKFIKQRRGGGMSHRNYLREEGKSKKYTSL